MSWPPRIFGPGRIHLQRSEFTYAPWLLSSAGPPAATNIAEGALPPCARRCEQRLERRVGLHAIEPGIVGKDWVTEIPALERALNERQPLIDSPTYQMTAHAEQQPDPARRPSSSAPAAP